MADTPPPLAASEQHRFPCAECGADMRFDPKRGLLVCAHCGSERAIEAQDAGPWGPGQSSIRELDFRSAVKNQLAESEIEVTRVWHCTSCGAEVEFQPAIHAAECPFCGSPVVGDTGENRHIKPRGVLPFAVDEAAARQAMVSWLGRIWFAPSGLQQYARAGRRMEGIYIPYWTFDAETESRYSGERGEVHTRTVRGRDGQPETVSDVRWFPARGRVARFFDDILVPGSRTLPKPTLDALPPWDLSRLMPYKSDYLAGMRAEAYQIELDEAFHVARAHIDRVIERDVRFDIGGDMQRIHNIDTKLGAITFKHVLLPVWVAVYRYQGKAYQILINGQSGRVQGERPYSVWKIAVAVVLAAIVGGIIAYVMAQQQGLTR